VRHVLAGSQLAVGDVKKVAAADQLDETVPGVDVRLIVGDVAVGQPVCDRDRAVGW
jgi:hypothetical protein